MDQQTVLEKLKDGDRRSIGRSNQVVALVRRDRALFPALMGGMHDTNELVRMRAADAVEKLTVTHPEWLRPYKAQLIRLAAKTTQQELKWHLAQMLPRLDLSARERKLVVVTLRSYLEDQSRIVKTFAMQGLADFAMQDPRLRPSIRRLISSLIRIGSPAMKSRGRKLLLQLATPNLPRHAPVSL